MKKIILGLFLFIALAAISIQLINVKAEITAEIHLTNGASIRKEGDNGIKFKAYVDAPVEGAVYGMVFAQGKVADLTVNTPNTFTAEVTEVEEVEEDGVIENQFRVTMIKFPETSYAQNISVRAYIRVGETYKYSEEIVTRNLAELCLSANKKGITGSTISTILSTLKTSYKKVAVDENGYIFINSATYETDLEKLEAEFVEDWNNLFGTSWTEITYSALQASASSGDVALTADGDKDCSKTNLYTFFNTNAETKAKWGWFLNYLAFVGKSKVHPIRQITALQGDGTASDTYGSGMQMFKHLSASITNFFNGGSSRDANNDISFFDPTLYASIADYNNTIYATASRFTTVDKTISLPSVEAPTAYEFSGYTVDEILYEGNYTVTSSNVVLVPTFKPIEYSVKYFDHETELTDIESSYTIESDDIVLATYNKEGYAFKGWYTTPDFQEGTEVTEIPAGSMGEKVYYAKFESSSNVLVDVTYELNGGLWNTDVISSYANILHKATLTRYLSYDSNGYEASLYTSKVPAWWYYIGLNSTAIENVYEIAGYGQAGSSNFSHSYDYVITWHANLSDTESNAVLSEIKNDSYIGKYVAFENIPEQSGTCEIEFIVIESSETTKSITKQYQNPEKLFTPIKTGYEFVGWQSSVDGNTYNEFPGYKESPGSITYTAVWASSGSVVIETTTADNNVIYAVEPTIYVNKQFTSGKVYFVNGVELEYGVNAFASIKDALTMTTSGDIIYVFAGTYADALTISTNNISIYGPNFNISGNKERFDEATISAVTKVSASNVTINGLAFTGSAALEIGEVSNTSLISLYSDAASSYTYSNVTFNSIIYSAHTLSDLLISDSYFYGEGIIYRPVVLTAKSTNVTIENNEIKNSIPATYSGNAGMAITIYNIDGVFKLQNNIIDFTTQNYSLYFGNGSNTCSEMWIKDNTFTGDYIATMAIQNFKSITGAVHFVGNIIENSNTGNNFNFSGCTGSVYVKYNYFNNCTYKLSVPATAQFANNYYNPAPTVAPYSTEYNANKAYTNEQRISDYYMDDTYNEGVLLYSITYIYGDKVIEDLTPTQFTEFSTTIILPTYDLGAHYTFLGWYDNPEFIGDPITEIPAGSIDDRVFFARVETSLIGVEVTLDADGGKLPISFDNNSKTISIYDNGGLASGTYLCDTSIKSMNSLRWQNKVLLNYDANLDAYKVVYLDAATISAFESGVTWSHALANASVNITTEFTVGQYVILEKEPSVGDTEFKYVVTNNVTTYQYPTEVNLVLTEETLLPTPVKEGYEFLGWESSIDGSIVTTHPNYTSNPGAITYTATWKVANLEEVTIKSEDELVINSVEPNLYVNASFEEGMTYVIHDENYTYGDTAFATIKEALAVATNGEKIYVFGGTYSDALTISTSVSIYGPYYNVHGKELNARTNEAIISNLVTVSASNVKLAGLKFTGTGSFVDTVSSSHTAAVSIYSNKAISNLTIIDSRFSTSINNYRPIYTTTNTTTNVSICNNYFANGSTGWGIVLYKIGGIFSLQNNEFYYSTAGYSMRLGTSANSCTEMWIKDNVITGNKIATIELRNFTSSSGAVHFVGNTIENSNTGNNFNFNGCTGNVYVKYNYFNNCAYKLTYKGSKTTFANNYYNPAPVNDTSVTTDDVYVSEYSSNSSYTNEKRLDDYACDTTYNNGASTYSITYMYNNEEISSLTPTRYTSNSSTIILPSYEIEHYNFIGWYDNPEFTGNIITEIPSGSTGDIVLYACLEEIVYSDIHVTFDYNGGATEDLYKDNGTSKSTLVINNYNGDYWTDYATCIFASTKANDPTAKFSWRVYLGVDEFTGLYKVISKIAKGTVSSWPTDATLVLTVWESYEGTGDDNFVFDAINVGDIVLLDKTITQASTNNLVTATFYDAEITDDIVEVNLSEDFVLPAPGKSGLAFAGWYDEAGNLYKTIDDFAEVTEITVTAKWAIDDQMIGLFETNSWVVIDDQIELNASFASKDVRPIAWKSETPNIATVDETGSVTGVSEGLATIVAYDATYPSISFTFYVTVVANADGIVGLLLNSNNESIYTTEDLIIGILNQTPAPYYADIIGSVSKLLFTPYVEHTNYYVSNPSNISTLTGSGKGGVDFITFHYAADMNGSATTGGKTLASLNKTYNSSGTGASWHYGTGNDGIWACQNTSYGAWHAGSSQSMTWHATGVTTSDVGTDVYTTDVTLKSDNYFYIKGVKTTVKNTTGYSYTKFNNMGLGVKLVGDEWYVSGHYYKSGYGYICSVGGNQNSIGIESSVAKGSDLWLTWQYSAQLCAKLLDQFNLPLNRLVGHHFFTGKWCPQPMLENNLEIWYEFREMVRQELLYRQNYSSYSLTCSSDSSYINSLGRITSLPEYSECVTYNVTYKTGSTSKTITISTILPGTNA